MLLQFTPENLTQPFLQEDPVWATNLYSYAYNNPLKYVDPLGADAILVEEPWFTFNHQVVWIGPDRNGNYTGFGLEPNSYHEAVWSLGTGRDVSGYIQQDTAIGASFYYYSTEIARRPQSSLQDAALIAQLRAQMRIPQTYNVWTRNCQQWAGPHVYGRP